MRVRRLFGPSNTYKTRELRKADADADGAHGIPAVFGAVVTAFVVAASVPSLAKGVGKTTNQAANKTISGSGDIDDGTGFEIETEAAFADSEGALAEAEEARQRAKEEKSRATKEKMHAQHETERARKAETDAKMKLAKWMKEEAESRKAREASEKKTQEAQVKLKALATELQAKELELQALKEVADQAEGERRKTEQAVIQARERLQKLEARFTEERKRREEAKAQTIKDQAKLQSLRDQMKAMRDLNRQTASALASASSIPPGGRGARTTGWVRLKKDCSLHASAQEDAAKTRVVKEGEKLYGHKHNEDWLQIQDQDGKSSFLSVKCIR